LKLDNHGVKAKDVIGYNRTIEELKPGKAGISIEKLLCYNRTIEELKLTYDSGP